MDIIKKYSALLVKHPVYVMIFSIIFTLICFSFYGNLETKSMKIDEILPPTYEVVDSILKLKDDLGGGESTAFMIVLEIEPEFGSEINDIRDYRVIDYIDLITVQVSQIKDVTGAIGMSDTIRSLNGGLITKSNQEIKKIISQNPNSFSRTVNDKYTLTVIRVFANEGFDVTELTKEVNKIIDNTKTPQGIKVQLAGESIAEETTRQLTGSDSAKTTQISLIAIIVILLITFRKVIYTVLPLFTIIFGVMWTFGFMAISGIKMSSFSSGAIAMIVGIGIDFGIQTIMRFRQELETSNPVSAMEKTLINVLKPMFITTVASFIGFYSMMFGDFTILGELGKIMAIGVIFCFFAAITIVPAISVIYEKHKPDYKLNSPIKVLKKIKLLITGKADIK